MKQKLLNSFTWRGTLLVALLSCAFSAWAEDYVVTDTNNNNGFWGQTIPTTLTTSSFESNVPGYFKEITVTASASGSASASITISIDDGEEPVATGTIKKKNNSVSYKPQSEVFGKKIKIEITKYGT